MKKVKVILVATALLIGTLFTTAAVPTPVVKTNFSVEIGKLLENPNFDMEVTTSVCFIINSEGELVVLSVDTKNTVVERFIKSRLNYEKINSRLIKGKEYTVPVRIVKNE